MTEHNGTDEDVDACLECGEPITDSEGAANDGLCGDCADEQDDCDEDGTDGGCSRCESMGLCPACGSASPGRCGCNDEDEDDDEEVSE